MNELTVVLKDPDKTCRHNFVIYEKYEVSQDDPVILKCIEEAKKSFDGEPENVQVKIHLEIQ